MDTLITNTIIIALSSILGYFHVIKPTRAYLRKKSVDDANRLYREFQTYAVKKHYPAVAHLSLREIQEEYNVTASYNRIGY